MLKNKGFSIVEVLISLSLLTIISSFVLTIFGSIFYESKIAQKKLNIGAKALENMEKIGNKIKNGKEFFIFKEKNFDSLLIKNKLSENKFTFIKSFSKEKSENKKLGIMNFNLFGDFIYNKKFGFLFSSPGNSSIFQFKNGTVSLFLGGKNSKLQSPGGLFMTNKALFISDYGNHSIFSINHFDLFNTIEKRNENLKLIAGKLGKSGAKNGKLGKNLLNSPKGLDYFENNLFIVDSGNHSVKKLDLKSGILSTFLGKNKKGFGNDFENFENFYLNNPTDIIFDKNTKTFFLTDTGNHRIIAFSKEKNIKPFAISGKNKKSDFFKKTRNLFYKFSEKEMIKDNFKNEINLENEEKINAKFANLKNPSSIKKVGNQIVFLDSGNDIFRKIYPFKGKNFLESENFIENMNIKGKNFFSFLGGEDKMIFLEFENSKNILKGVLKTFSNEKLLTIKQKLKITLFSPRNQRNFGFDDFLGNLFLEKLNFKKIGTEEIFLIKVVFGLFEIKKEKKVYNILQGSF